MKLKKIFNLFYKDIVSDDCLTRYRSLFNIIATRYFLNGNRNLEKEYILFGKVIFKWVIVDTKKIWTFFGFSFQEDMYKIFKKQYYKYYKNHDDIYLFYINSGEVFLFLKYILHKLIKKRNSKNPLILTNRQYHKDLVKLFYPQIPCVYVKKLKLLNQELNFKVFDYDFTLIVPKWHLDNVELGANKKLLGFDNYFHALLDLYNCDKNNIEGIKASIQGDFEKSMLKKIKKTGLNLDNFVFLAPEADSCKELSGEFWSELIKRLKNNGYDVFVNLVKNNIKIEDVEYKNTFLTLGEAFALCNRAKRIIALRSGICELLSETNVKMDVLYTGFRKKPFFRAINCEQVMHSFGFHNLTDINYENINEFDATGSFEDLFEQLGIKS